MYWEHYDVSIIIGSINKNSSFKVPLYNKKAGSNDTPVTKSKTTTQILLSSVYHSYHTL